MDHNNKKGRLISDALINRTEDFLIEKDDILIDEDTKKNDEDLKDGSFSESFTQDSFFNNEYSEPLHSTDRFLITEEHDDEDLLNVPSEIIVPDKKHSKTATEYLSIEHITDLYSPNTGTFNTMSVHDASFVRRENEADPPKSKSLSLCPKNSEVVFNLQNDDRSTNPQIISKFDEPIQKKKALDKAEFEKLTTVEFKLEPTNYENNKINNSLVKQDQIFDDQDLAFESKALDTLVSKKVVQNNIFEASSIVKEFNNKEILVKPNYRDDKFEKTNAIDFYLGDDDYSMEDISFQPKNDDLNETDSRIQLSLENDPAVIPRKMTVNMQDIEADIDQITNGDKSNLYRYIKTGNSNLATANFLKQTAYKQETNKNIEPKNDHANSEELKMVLNRNNNSALVFKQIDEQIKKEAQLEKQVRSRSYPNDYDQSIEATRTRSNLHSRERSRIIDSKKELINSRNVKNNSKKRSTLLIIIISFVVIAIIAAVGVYLGVNI